MRSPERRTASGATQAEGPTLAKAARRWARPPTQEGGSTSAVVGEGTDDEGVDVAPPVASFLGIIEEGPPEQRFEDLTLDEQQEGEKGGR